MNLRSPSLTLLIIHHIYLDNTTFQYRSNRNIFPRFGSSLDLFFDFVYIYIYLCFELLAMFLLSYIDYIMDSTLDVSKKNNRGDRVLC